MDHSYVLPVSTVNEKNKKQVIPHKTIPPYQPSYDGKPEGFVLTVRNRLLAMKMREVN